MKNTVELAAERYLKRLNDGKFEPYVVEYNLKEN